MRLADSHCHLNYKGLGEQQPRGARQVRVEQLVELVVAVLVGEVRGGGPGDDDAREQQREQAPPVQTWPAGQPPPHSAGASPPSTDCMAPSGTPSGAMGSP